MTTVRVEAVNPTVYQRLGGQSTMTRFPFPIFASKVYQRLGGQSTMTTFY